MLPKKLYVTNWKLEHDGIMHAPGTVIALESNDARFLVEAGAIRVARVAERSNAVELPPDFPAREQLIRSGLHTLDKIREATDADLLSVRRVGSATVQLIRDRLSEIESGLG